MPLAVCATPIGNLEDVTLRVLGELAACELVLCEDTRRTATLLARHRIRVPLLSYHAHNEAERIEEILPRLRGGARVALVSDAGLPGISDPGARIVGAALEAGVPVAVLPGASAVETALVASGFAAGRYRFLGFLPRREPELRGLWRELAGIADVAVAFESPRRLPATLASLAHVDPGRQVAVCRELTKVFEEVVRGSAEEVRRRYEAAPKGEVTIVIGPAAAAPGAPPDEGASAVQAVSELVAAGTPRRVAAGVVARLTGAKPNALYRSSL